VAKPIFLIMPTLKERRAKKRFKFGDIIENEWASLDNPIRKGVFIRYQVHWKNKVMLMTDGKDYFWLGNAGPDAKNKKIGTILNAPTK